jgi:hypothetical protein
MILWIIKNSQDNCNPFQMHFPNWLERMWEDMMSLNWDKYINSPIRFMAMWSKKRTQNVEQMQKQ